jgi:hypothetical protein
VLATNKSESRHPVFAGQALGIKEAELFLQIRNVGAQLRSVDLAQCRVAEGIRKSRQYFDNTSTASVNPEQTAQLQEQACRSASPHRANDGFCSAAEG